MHYQVGFTDAAELEEGVPMPTSKKTSILSRKWSKLGKTIQAAIIGAVATIVAAIIALIPTLLAGSSGGSPPSGQHDTGSPPSGQHDTGSPPSGQHDTSSPPSGQHDTSPMQSPGMSVAVSDQSYRVIFPITNSQNIDQQLEKVTLFVSFHGPACAEIPELLLYKIQSTVTVDSSGKIKEGTVSAESGLASGFNVPAAGELNFGCSIDQLQLSFLPAGAMLTRLSTTPVVIDIPRQLNVTYLTLPLPLKQALHYRAPLPSIGNPSEVDYIAFHIIAWTNSGNKLSSCFLLTGSQTSLGPGIRNCDSTIEGVHVFWREIFDPKHQWEAPPFKKMD
jgi:hypothetical protein